MQKIDLSSINKKHVAIKQPKNPKPVKNNDEAIKKPIKPAKPEKPLSQKPKNPIAEKVVLSDLDRSKRVKLLELYVIEFPEELQRYKNVNFSKCKDHELVEYKELFDKSASSMNNLAWGVNISQQALQIYETIGKLGGLQIDGISKLGQDPNFIKNIKAVCLKYMDGGITFIEPEHQLLFMIFQHTLMLHYLNTSGVPKEQKQVESLVDVNELQKINQEFSDI